MVIPTSYSCEKLYKINNKILITLFIGVLAYDKFSDIYLIQQKSD